jgi:FKBP-type peptidyl-prolyl cis-trans isomerase FklB
MKKLTLTAVAAAFVLLACNDATEEKGSITLTSNIDSVSYAIGVNSANGLSQQFSEGNMDAYLQGFKDVLDSADLLVSTEEAQGVIQAYSQRRQMEEMAKKQQENEAMYGDAKAEGIAFLEENKTKEGVITTASGLQYVVLKAGTGSQPVATSQVKVHYHGTTPDGTVFDSSVDRGEPIDFGLNQVIPGWTEGVQLMKEGAKYRFFIPQELAYGANPPQGGQGPIKPFMPLVFEVELIKINN